MIILICGSRTKYDVTKTEEELQAVIKENYKETFVHGGAVGVDSQADKALKILLPEYSNQVKIF